MAESGTVDGAAVSFEQTARDFFRELSPRIETAHALDEELDRQLARKFNVFRYLRTDEHGFSKMIADLLDPKGDHGQGDTFLRCLIKRLGDESRDGKYPDWPDDLSGAKVEREKAIDGRRLDIVVEIDGRHCCMAIENKSNWAGDQREQVSDYLNWLKGYDKHLLIYLSPDGAAPSEESIPSEQLKELSERRPCPFAIMSCGPASPPDDDAAALRLGFSLIDWLADCRRNCDVDRLRWYLREVETHCQHWYGGTTVTDAKSRAIRELLRSDRKWLEIASAVRQAYPSVETQIVKEFSELISTRLKSSLQDCNGRIRAPWAGGNADQWPRVAYYSSTSWDAWETSICLELGRPYGHLYMGVRSSDHKEGRKQLEEHLRTEGGRGIPENNWWWPYRESAADRGNSVLQMHQEVNNGGDLSNRIVKRFKKLVHLFEPIINGFHAQ